MKISWRRAWQPTPVYLPGEFSWTEEPGGLQSMGLQRVGHNWSNLSRMYEACSLGDSTSDISERLLQRGSGEKSICKISVKGRVQCSQALTLQEVFCKSGGADGLMKGFSAFLEMRRCRGSWNQFLKISNCLKTCSTSFPGGQSASLSTLNSPQGVWKVNSYSSTSTAEVDGQWCPWQVPICSWDGKESICNAGDLGLEQGMATHSSILAWRIPMARGAWWATVHGVTESRIWVSD